jgi:hypothetical protein
MKACDQPSKDREKAAIQALKSAISDPDKQELRALFAAQKKANLDAYLAAGFTREEAFALVIQGGSE